MMTFDRVYVLALMSLSWFALSWLLNGGYPYLPTPLQILLFAVLGGISTIALLAYVRIAERRQSGE